MSKLNYAYFANEAYKNYQGKAESLLGYNVDPSLSDRDRVVYYNPTTKKAVVAFRGTIPTDVTDLVADKAILTRSTSKSPRFIKSAQVVKKARDKYGKENLVLTGHSLGGAQALTINTWLNGEFETHAYNPGTMYPDWYLFSSKKDNVYRTGKDVVSKGTLTRGQQIWVAPKEGYDTTLGSHSLENFL